MITNFTFKETFLPKDTNNAIAQMFGDFLTHIKFALQNKMRNTVDLKAETFENYYGKVIKNTSSFDFKDASSFRFVSDTFFRFCQHS